MIETQSNVVFTTDNNTGSGDLSGFKDGVTKVSSKVCHVDYIIPMIIMIYLCVDCQCSQWYVGLVERLALTDCKHG